LLIKTHCPSVAKDAGHKERLEQLYTSPACTTTTTQHAVTNPAADAVKKFRTS